MSYKVLEQNGVTNENIDGAAFNSFCTNGKSGVVKGVLRDCATLNPSGNILGIDTGLLVFQGFRVKIFEPIYFSFLSSNPAGFYSLIFKIELREDRSVLSLFDIIDQRALTKDSFLTEEEGVYESEILSAYWDGSTLSSIQRKIEFLESGSSTQIELVQDLTGDATDKAVSQKSVKDALGGKVDKSSIAQTLGDGEDLTISQKAVTGALNELGKSKLSFNVFEFEKGTAYNSGGNLIYTSAECIRVVQNKTLELRKGDYLLCGSGIKTRVLLIREGVCEEVFSFAERPVMQITESGEYVLVFAYVDGRAIATASELLQEVSIFRPLSTESKLDGLVYKTHIDKYIPIAYGENVFVNAYGNLAKESTAPTRSRTELFISRYGTPINIITATNIVMCVYKSPTGKIGAAAEQLCIWETKYSIPCDEENYYVLSFKKIDDSEILDGEELAFCLIGNVYEEIKKIADERKPKIDNDAKGVFSVMSYNVGQWYNGSGSVAPLDKSESIMSLQKNIIERYQPDILCLQEYTNEHFLQDRYFFVEAARETTSYDGKAICTNRSLEDAENIPFTTTEGAMTRNYEKAYVYMNGRRVCVISAHLSLTSSAVIDNVDELLDAVADEDYFIICGDFNVDCTNDSASLYQSTLKKFTDLGYKLCNGGDFGVFATYASTNIAIDNIITSSNITIKSVVMDTQKAGLEDGTDHYPLVAYVEVY